MAVLCRTSRLFPISSCASVSPGRSWWFVCPRVTFSLQVSLVGTPLQFRFHSDYNSNSNSNLVEWEILIRIFNEFPRDLIVLSPVRCLFAVVELKSKLCAMHSLTEDHRRHSNGHRPVGNPADVLTNWWMPRALSMPNRRQTSRK